MIQAGIVAAQVQGASPSPVAREYAAAESLGAVYNSDQYNPTPQGLTLTHTTALGANYVLFWCAEVQCESSAMSALVRVLEDGVLAEDCYIRAPGNYTGEWNLQGGFIFHTGAGDAVTWSMDVAITNNLFLPQRAGVRNARFALLRLRADDFIAENLAGQANGTHTFGDAVSVSFTPATAGSYLILGYGGVASAPGAQSQVRLWDGGAGAEIIGQGHYASSELLATTAAWVQPALSGPQTFSLQWNFSQIYGARILALKLLDFTHAFRATLGVDDSGTETSFTRALSLTRDIAASDVLTLAIWQSDGASSDPPIEARALDPVGTINTASTFHRPSAVASAHFACRIGAIAAGRRTWAIERKVDDPPNAALVRAGAVLCVLQLTS